MDDVCGNCMLSDISICDIQDCKQVEELQKKYTQKIKAETIDEFIAKAKELYPNDNSVLYKLQCIAGQLKEQKYDN